EAMAEYRAALRLQPDYAKAHTNLGIALAMVGRLPEAVAELREAVRLRPDDPEAHCNLGSALVPGQLPEALAEPRQALRLKPESPLAHYNLGNALSAQGDPDQAVASYWEAVRLRPDYAEAHCNLGSTLTQLGEFRRALAAYRRGDELGRRQPGWRFPSGEWVKQAERRVELDEKLPALLRGDSKPRDAAEQIELAGLCETKGLPAAAARF